MLPTRIRDVLRNGLRRYRRIRYRLYPKITIDKMRRILRENLGVKRGGVVFIHSSTEKLNADFSATSLLKLLLEEVGPEGTLLFPCTHISTRAEDYLKSGAVFDVRKSPTTMGLLPELARRHKDAVRSLHPTNSVVAIGKHAEALTASHATSTFPCDENSPYYKIVEYDGVIVGLGITSQRLSFVHCVEDILRERFPVRTRTDTIYQALVRNREGEEIVVPTVAQTPATKWMNIPRYMKRYIPKNICCDMKIDNVSYFHAKSSELFTRMETLCLHGKTIYSRGAFSRYARISRTHE